MFDPAEETLCVVTGHCVCVHSCQACVTRYDVSVVTDIIKSFIVVSAKYSSLCSVWVHCVSIRAAHDNPEMDRLWFMFPPMKARGWTHTLPKARPTCLYSKYSRAKHNHVSSERSLALSFCSYHVSRLYTKSNAHIFSFPRLWNIWVCQHGFMCSNNHETNVWIVRAQGDMERWCCPTGFFTCVACGLTLGKEHLSQLNEHSSYLYEELLTTHW